MANLSCIFWPFLVFGGISKEFALLSSSFRYVYVVNHYTLPSKIWGREHWAFVRFPREPRGGDMNMHT